MSRDKTTSLENAVGRIDDGATVAAGLALEHAIPFAAGHELIRQDVDGLALVGPISDLLFDQLVGAGCVDRIRAAWVGNVSAGIGYCFRRAVEDGGVDVENHSNFSIALALKAGALGVPYLPTRSLLGSDILAESDSLRTAEDPFSGDPLVLVPAIEPDWSIVHVQRASPAGDVHFWGNTGVTAAAVGAADNVLVTAEEIVDPEVIKSDPSRTLFTRENVAAVAQVPQVLHYQATLVEGDFPAEGEVDVEVAFFAEETGGTALADWRESYEDVSLTNGRIDLLLGSQTPLPDTLFEGSSLYLQLVVEGETLPRLPVASTAFALRAGVAENVASGGVTADGLADAAVTRSSVAERAISSAALANESVSTRALVDDAVTTPKIAGGAVETDELANGAVTSGKLGSQAVDESRLADGAVGTDKLANGAVTESKVATGHLVTGLNGLTDAVRLVEGDDIQITPDAEAGTITIESDSDGGWPSSRRWKTNIEPLGDALALVQRLRGVRYQWIESGETDVGLIAEEVGDVVPEVVTYADNGEDAETVEYARLVALLIEAVKAQQEQIESERAQLEDLKTRIEALERAQSTP
jgi:glutaconate CoA-transferase subunit A